MDCGDLCCYRIKDIIVQLVVNNKEDIMRLTKEKLIALWKIREHIFDNPINANIINRYKEVASLFKEIADCNISFDEETKVYTLNGTEIVLKDGTKPSVDCYFSCKKDEITENYAFGGVKKMCERFPEEFKDLITKIGCVLGGFTMDDEHIMIDEYRIISNSSTGWSDNKSLTSTGQIRHPSSHFADNNYFFNVINTIKYFSNETFQWDQSKLVLRWPNSSYYSDDEQAEKLQKEALRYRFPYKFFYMWTHDVLHPVSLMAYRNLVLQEDSQIKYAPDSNLGQDIMDFTATNGWRMYSSAIKNMIPEDEQGENFWEEMSKLISIVMIQDQQMKNIQELLETGNKAIILYGPPGTGKTYSAKELICSELGISNKELEDYKFNANGSIKEKGAWALVQFHPNYTYEDFIGGISPCLTSGSLSYTLKTGIFKKICDEASKADNVSKKFIIVIDEINRADLSSVFGELMYALEYRDEPISIPNFQELFVIPSNVYIIGTMNSIDKSLVTFDLALRRRFGFIKIMPQLQVLETILSDYNIEESCLTNFIARCRDLNEHISRPNSRLQLGVDYQIGHAYYGKIKDFLAKSNESDPVQIITTFDLEKLWEYHLEPLLEEFLGNRIEDSEVIRCLEERKNEFTKPLVCV